MSEATLLQLILTGATFVGTGALALVQHLSKKADTARDERLEDIHSAVLALRSDFRTIDSDVRKHSEQLGGLGAVSQATSERIRSLENVIQRIVQNGCAHRRYCRTPTPPEDDTTGSR